MFKIKALQSDIYLKSGIIKSSKNILKLAETDSLQYYFIGFLQCSHICHRRGYMKWFYFFMMKRIDLHYNQGDIPLCFSLLDQSINEAKSRKHIDIMVLIYILLRYILKILVLIGLISFDQST